MGKFIHQITAYGLLLSMLVVFMPKQVLSHHEHELRICNESDIHFEEKEHDCELCSFLLSKILIAASATGVEAVSYYFPTPLLLDETLCFGNKYVFHLRGPPRT